MNRIEKLKNDLYSFAALDTLEKNAIKLRDAETLRLITSSRTAEAAGAVAMARELDGQLRTLAAKYRTWS